MSRKQTLPPELPPDAEARLLEAAWKESLSAVTLGFAHDLNNALTGILGLAEVMLLEAQPGDPAHEHLGQMKHGTRQAADLVERLAALHRAKPGRREFHDLNTLVTQSLEFLRFAVPKRLQLAPELCTTQLPVFADAVEFQHAFSCLVISAVRATPEQGQITIRTSLEKTLPAMKLSAGAAPRAPTACLTVKSDGAHIPAKSLPALFEPWSGSANLGGGPVLGLFPARRFVERQAGAIAVSSSKEAGTVVRVFLPVADFTEAASQRPA